MVFRRVRDRRGTILPLVAVCIVAIVGMAALVLDAGIIKDDLRMAQCAADSAALAGAKHLYDNWENSGIPAEAEGLPRTRPWPAPPRTSAGTAPPR